MSGAGAMSYVAESDTGHMTLMHARLKRLHDSMAARGASPAALARLPRLPQRAAPLDRGLPPVVLATARQIGPQGRYIEVVRPAKQRNPRVEQLRRQALIERDARQLMLGRKIIKALCDASGLTEYQLLGQNQNRYWARIRCLGMVTAKGLKMPNIIAAGMFNRERSAVTHALKRVPFWLQSDRSVQHVYGQLVEQFPEAFK